MRIPIAKDNVNRIAPDVSGIQPIAPVAADSGLAKAGEELKQSMQNAADGFVKLYQADQRADVIKYFNDYQNAVKEYRDSAEKDPTTGQPVGFTQLIGDQVNEDSLKAAQDKVEQARIKFDKSIRGVIPDLQDEFGMRADEVQANFDTATNAHFLKAKYEKAKNAADLDNENLKNNTYFGANDAAKMESTYKSLYDNYYSYLQDGKAAEKQARADMENIIKNNVTKIKEEGEDTSYDKARAFLNSPMIKKALSKASYDAMVHDVDKESTEWQMRYLDMDTPTIQNYIKNKTTHLTPKEKALFIAQAQKRDTSRAGGSGEKKVSVWYEMVSRVANGQPNYFSAPNEFGIYTNKPVSEAETRQFQANFLTFTQSLLGALNNTPYNEAVIKQQGLKAVLPEDQLKMYTSEQVGPLMKQAVKQIDYALKSGALELLDTTQTSALGTLVGQIQKGNWNLGKLRAQRLDLESKLLDINDRLKTNPNSDDINAAMTYLRQYENIAGQIVVGFDDTTFLKTKRELMSKITDNMIKAQENNMGIIDSIGAWGTGIAGKAREFLDVFNYKGQLTEAQVNKNNELIARWNKIAHTNGKNEDGTRSIIPEAYKILRSAAWEMMNGDGITVYNVREDGTIDPMTAEKRKAFAIDDFRENGIDPVNSDNVVYDTISQFMGLMNSKYQTNKFNDLRTLDFDTLTSEDRKVFQELLSRNWMSANGFENKTFLPTIPMGYDYDAKAPRSVFNPSGIMIPGVEPQKAALEKAKQPYIGPLDANLSDLRVKDFAGGVASNEDLSVLLENGYSDFEDYSVQLMLNNEDPNVHFDRSEILHDMLSSLAPDGLRSKFVDPEDNQTKQYYYLMSNVNKAGYVLEKNPAKRETMEQVHKDELMLLTEILRGLVKDNPDMNQQEFLTPGVISYDVSDETYNNAVEKYNALRKYRVSIKKDMYMNMGGIAPSKQTLMYWKQQGEENN